jgi:hypothetical protein
MIGHLLIEGGSTAQGYGDERRKGGYAGRLLYHYGDYNTAQYLKKDRSLPYIYVHTNGLVDNTALRYAQTLPNNIQRAKSINGFGRHEMKLVGIFAIGGALDVFAHERGSEVILEEWRLALNGIKKICQEQEVHPIYIGIPKRNEHTQIKGKVPDRDLGDRQAAITAQLLPDLIPFETMAGTGLVLEQSPLYKGIHPNAAGHDKIEAYLIPRIDAAFGIESSYDPNRQSHKTLAAQS